MKRLTKIIIEEKPFKSLRYNTIGDWYRDKNGVLHIEVAAGHSNGAKAVLAVAIHEMIEVLKCEEHGVTDAVVTAWDKKHQKDDEPGEIPGAPYFTEHAAANRVEHAAVEALDMGSFDQYNQEWADIWDREVK